MPYLFSTHVTFLRKKKTSTEDERSQEETLSEISQLQIIAICKDTRWWAKRNSSFPVFTDMNTVKAYNFVTHGNFGPFLADSVATMDEVSTKKVP
jgi:hypothetical protein